jgi:hypothetical protein
MLFDQRLVENNLSIDQALLQTRSGRFFYKLTEWPKLVLALSLVAVIAASFFLTTLTLNTTMEAFIDPDHPSITLRKKVRDIFGLSSPVVIAIVNEGPTGIFNPETLNLVSWFTDELINIPDVDPERITSLSTEKNIYGTQDGMKVSPFFEYPPETQEEANMVRTAVMNFPLYIGSLVANDGKNCWTKARAKKCMTRFYLFLKKHRPGIIKYLLQVMQQYQVISGNMFL